MILRKHFYLLIWGFFILSCARQTSPTGGPKDTIPPILKNTIPPKQQINFDSKDIQLLFDENVATNNPKEQIIITPDVAKEYDITAKGKQVTLTFKNKLKDSTTYSINFRDAIKDITEKNSAVNLKYAFSTGHYIDSLSIEGNVYDPLKGKEIKDATVAIFQQDTFNIFQHKPVYITKSDAKGKYIIENLKPGNYYAYAIDDKNRNLIADSKTEAYGFLADTIVLKANKKEANIPIIKLDTRGLKLTNSRPYNTYFNIKTSKNLAHYSIKANGNEIVSTAFGEDRANVKVYNTFDQDSTAITFHAVDSINNTIDTTLYVKFSEREVKKEPFTVNAEDFKIFLNNGTLKGKIKINKPLLTIDSDSILFKIDSLKIITFTRGDFSVDTLNNLITVDKKIDKKLFEKPEEKVTTETKALPQQKLVPNEQKNAKPKKEIVNEFYIGNAAFISIELDSSKLIQQQIKPMTFEETGVIITQIQTTEKNFVVQLLDKSFNVVQFIANDKKATFRDIVPGEYQVRLVIDRNQDQRWSPGNFLTRQEPEPLVFYRSEKDNPIINLKANWEIGPLLITF